MGRFGGVEAVDGAAAASRDGFTAAPNRPIGVYSGTLAMRRFANVKRSAAKIEQKFGRWL